MKGMVKMTNDVVRNNTFDISGKTLDAKILETLINGNGFSVEDVGTYYYKDVIRGIVFSLNAINGDADFRKKQILDDINFNFLTLSGVIDSNCTKEQLCLLIDKDRQERITNLRCELQELHSMFYYNVSRNFSYVTNFEFFHAKIKEAASKTNLKDTYLQVAYYLGTYISNLLVEDEMLLTENNLNNKLVRDKK